LNTFDISLNYTYNDRLYADFDPTLRNDPNDREQSHRLPAYSLIDLHLGYSFDFFSYKAFAGFSCYNLMDTEYIMRGEDGSTHDLSSFQGYWGFGRTFNFNLKLNF